MCVVLLAKVVLDFNRLLGSYLWRGKLESVVGLRLLSRMFVFRVVRVILKFIIFLLEMLLRP